MKELEQKTGLTRHAIRFYEKAGFLDQRAIRRGTNNYRDYAEEVVERLRTIKAGQAAGFTLAELKELIDACGTGQLTTQKQMAYLHQKIAEINRKRAELEQMQTYLTSILALKRAAEHEGLLEASSTT